MAAVFDSTSLASGVSLPTLPSASDSPPWIPSDWAMLSNQDRLPDNSSSPEPGSDRRRVKNPDHADDPDCSGDDDHARRRLLRNEVDQVDMMKKIDLGDRPQELDDKLHKSKKNKEREPPSPVRQSKHRRLHEEDSVLTPVATKDGGVYQPTNKESRAAYVSILGIVRRLLGSQPYNVLFCGADEVLALLKNGAFKKAPEKMKKKMEKLLFSPISSAVFDELVWLGNCITDFQHPGGAATDDVILEDVDGVEEEEEDDERNPSTVGNGDDETLGDDDADDVEDDEMQQGNEGMTLDVEEDNDPLWLLRREILKALRENISRSPEPESHLEIDDDDDDVPDRGNDDHVPWKKDSPPSSHFDWDVLSCPIRDLDYKYQLRENFPLSPEPASPPSSPSCLSPPRRDYTHLVRENFSISPEPESHPELKNPDVDDYVVVPYHGDGDHVPREKDNMMEKLEEEQAKRKRPVTSWNKDDLEVHYGWRSCTDDDKKDLNDPGVLCSHSKLHDRAYQGLPVYRKRKPRVFPWVFS